MTHTSDVEAELLRRLEAPRPNSRASADRRLREICHDLRHPAATIRALVAAIEVEAALPEITSGRLRQILAEARRIDELTSQVLQPASQDVLVRLDHVVVEVVADYGPLPVIDVVVVPVVARADDLIVRRVLWNLIDNARRAAGPAGRVLVSAWSSDEQVILEVTDDGPGFGGDAPEGAAALGMSIVQRLVESIGGAFQLGDSDAGGASVRVVLPVPDIDLASEERHGSVLMHSDE